MTEVQILQSAIRAQGGGRERASMRAFPPLAEDHPAVGTGCAVCGEPFVAGDRTTVIPLGPGTDPEDQRKALAGGWYSCLGTIGHASCAGILQGDE